MAIQYGIHDYKGFTPNLTTPQVELSTFNPVNIEYKPMDFGIYQKAVDKMDEAAKENQEKYSAFRQGMGKIRKENIHQDEKSLAVFNAKVDEIDKKFKEGIAGGNLHRVGDLISNFADDFSNDAVITGMMNSKAKYDDKIKEIDGLFNSGKIDDIRRKRLIYQLNKRFDNNFITDNTGKIIGTDEWKSNIDVVEKLDPAKYAATIQALTAPSKQNRGGTRDTLGFVKGDLKDQETGRLGGTDTYLKTTTTGGHTSVEELSTEMLDKTYQALKDNSLIMQLDAEIDDMIYQIQEYNEKLNNQGLSESDRSSYSNRIAELNTFLYDGGPGGGHPSREKIEKKLIQLIHQGAYKNIDSVTDNRVNISGGGSSESSGNTGGGQGGIDLTKNHIGVSHQKGININTNLYTSYDQPMFKTINDVNENDFTDN